MAETLRKRFVSAGSWHRCRPGRRGPWTILSPSRAFEPFLLYRVLAEPAVPSAPLRSPGLTPLQCPKESRAQSSPLPLPSPLNPLPSAVLHPMLHAEKLRGYSFLIIKRLPFPFRVDGKNRISWLKMWKLILTSVLLHSVPQTELFRF